MGSKQTDSDPEAPTTPNGLAPGAGQVIWVLWLTYGAFYFCRQNLAAAVPGLREHYSDLEIGIILGGLKVTYGVGQLINGQLAEQFSPRKLLAIGMLGSAALNVLFGFATGFYFLLFIWACNGYMQSLGWTPCLRVATDWFPVQRRGWAIGIIGTGYQVTGSLTYVVAGSAAEYFGWRGALYVPAAILAAAAIHMLLFLKEKPARAETDREIDALDDARPSLGYQPAPRQKLPFRETIWLTLSNPAVWLLALTLALLNACRYGYIDWGLSHLLAVQQEERLPEFLAVLATAPGAGSPASISWTGLYFNAPSSGVGIAALKYAILPLGGVAGAYLAGWASDRFFGGRRAPAMCALLVLLGSLSLIYDWMARTSLVGTILLLLVIGFAIYGPQVLLIGSAPADLARKGTAAAAAGFIDFMGYGGAFVGTVVTGFLTGYSWRLVVFSWAGFAFAAAAVAALLWNASGRHRRDKPGGSPGGAPTDSTNSGESSS